MKPHILIIEDEAKIAEILRLYLEKEGFRVTHALTGAEGLNFIKEEQPDLIILDLILPDIDGEELCKDLKRHYDIPVIMLTAKSSEDEKVRGFDAGADDYVVKPFGPKELIARIKARLRKIKKTERLSFNKGELIIDTKNHEVFIKNRPVTLTNTEFRILLLLAGRPGQIFTREDIISAVFGYDFEGYDRTVDVHIKNIRQKIEVDHRRPQFLKTVYGTGYKFAGIPDED
ncbi:MAG: response regulator transcription factor [Thermodesulfovibrionales bacterium]|nr:response regulator transcription factor [Thermodesulfovibrionales bacterium]